MLESSSKKIDLKCTSCGTTTPYSQLLSECPNCGAKVLKAEYNLDLLSQSDWQQQISKREANLWRYRELLPVLDPQNIVSLGEGYTPLTRVRRLGEKMGLKNLYLKDERQGPTGSFKDRQASVAISVMKERGIKELVLASTGNVAIAYSAYAARAGIKLWVFFPKLVPPEKIREAAVCGAEIIKIDGTYDEAKAAAADFAKSKNLFLDAGIKTFAGVESMKTMAFEIAEQLHWQSPDWYFQGVSGGMGPIGVAKGFEELEALGLVALVPAIGLIQSAGCAPMVNAFKNGQPKATPVENPQTAIATLATGNPGRAYELLYEILEENGGAMEVATDEEAYEMTRLLATAEGISVEPATAVTFVGLMKLARSGIIESDEVVVVNCSGHTYPVEEKILSN